jgi:hypothetical protein
LRLAHTAERLLFASSVALQLVSAIRDDSGRVAILSEATCDITMPTRLLRRERDVFRGCGADAGFEEQGDEGR